jgi:hypothetical protein
MSEEVEIMRAIRERETRFREIRTNRVREFIIKLCHRYDLRYRIVQMYHVRVAGRFDIYTANVKFHDIKNQKRGRIRNLKTLIQELAKEVHGDN